MAVDHEVERTLAGQFLELAFDGAHFHDSAVFASSEVDLLIHADGVAAGETVRNPVGVGERKHIGIELLAERPGLGRITEKIVHQPVHQIGRRRFRGVLPRVDPKAGFLFGGYRKVRDMHQLQRAAFVAEADGVKQYVGVLGPGLDPFLKIAVGVWVIQSDENRIAREPFVETARLGFSQREMLPYLPVVGEGTPRHAIVFQSEVDLFPFHARHPEIVPVRAGFQGGVDGVFGIVFPVDQEGKMDDRISRGHNDAGRVEQLGASEGPAFEVAVKADLCRADRRE